MKCETNHCNQNVTDKMNLGAKLYVLNTTGLCKFQIFTVRTLGTVSHDQGPTSANFLSISDSGKIIETFSKSYTEGQSDYFLGNHQINCHYFFHFSR